MTVPACEECNRGSSKDDEYLRLVLSADIGAERHRGADAAWEAAFRGLQRPQAEAFKMDFYRKTRPAQVVDQQGQPLGEVLTFEMSAERQGRVMARCARGLYFDDTQRVLPDYEVVGFPVNFLQQKAKDGQLLDFARRVEVVSSQRPGKELGAGVLTYWCEQREPFLLWWFVFFGGIPFFAIAMPKEPGKPLAPWFQGFSFPTA